MGSYRKRAGRYSKKSDSQGGCKEVVPAVPTEVRARGGGFPTTKKEREMS